MERPPDATVAKHASLHKTFAHGSLVVLLAHRHGAEHTDGCASMVSSRKQIHPHTRKHASKQAYLAQWTHNSFWSDEVIAPGGKKVNAKADILACLENWNDLFSFR